MIIHWDRLSADDLPDESAITTVTIAELSAGIHADIDPVERALRLDLLQ